jgi:hypothetical protein
MFIQILSDGTKKYPYTIAKVRADNPQVSFPSNPSDETLEAFGMFRVFFSTQPTFDESSQVLTEGVPVFNSDDARWEQTWSVRDMTAEEIANRTEQQGQQVRDQRNQKLSSSDWTQVIDAPVDQDAWAAYRQELRDIPSQVGFPWDVIWPTEPGV